MEEVPVCYTAPMISRYKLLKILGDGRFHSGEELGAALGVSRAAIWKQLQFMERMGLELQAVRGRGYRLTQALDLLEAEAILEVVSARGRQHINGLEIHFELASTNSYIRERMTGMAPGSVVLAERQTAGRGRRGRDWVSPFGRNLYLSLLWHFPQGAAELAGLSLAVGVAVRRALQSIGADGVGLKWPNDLLHDGAKLAGVLLDVSGESAGPCQVVTGIGINVDMPVQAAQDIDQPWTDLHTLTGEAVSRNQLAGQVIDETLYAMQMFQREGLAPFLDDWQQYDVTAGYQVTLNLADRHVSGEARGVDADGAFLLYAGGRLQRFASGEISLRMTT